MRGRNKLFIMQIYAVKQSGNLVISCKVERGLEFRGVNASAKVERNGQAVGTRDGG